LSCGRDRIKTTESDASARRSCATRKKGGNGNHGLSYILYLVFKYVYYGDDTHPVRKKIGVFFRGGNFNILILFLKILLKEESVKGKIYFRGGV
jgi:hypothetical protein